MSYFGNQPSPSDSEDLSLETILQRIFNENDPVAHRAAIWELLQQSGDWELYNKLSEFGGHKGITSYFQNIVNHIEGFDEAEDEALTTDAFPAENRERMSELYAAPLVGMRQGDWAGVASSMHEILLNEIYEFYDVNDSKIPFGDATASNLKNLVGEEILFPLSVIEYLAFSDCLTRNISEEILDNYLAFLLALFFNAQAYLDTPDGGGGDLTIYPEEPN